MSTPNVENRTIFCDDNLDVMRGINSECIDLIYLDPPFNKNKKFTAPIGSSAEGASFKDIFREDDLKEEWLWTIREDQPELYHYLDGINGVGKPYNFAYLAYMAIRLLEMNRILKSTGSIYLHCDPTMSHYLKVLMDCIFGEDNFRNEVIWRRSNAHNKTAKQFGPIHDILLFFSKSKKFTFHPGRRPYTKRYVDDRFTKKDERGQHQLNYLTGPGQRRGESGKEWRGFDPTKVGRHWAIPRSLRKYLPTEGEGMTSHDQLESLYKQGLIVFPKKPGGQPMYRQYVGGGVPYQDIWAYQPNTKDILFQSDEHIDQDVKWLEDEEERTGYPTQKPVGLGHRIIESSSNVGDMVLDPFCGCATTCIAAEKLERKWIGIDISVKAYELVQERLKKEVDKPQMDLLKGDTPLNMRTDPPVRTDQDTDHREKKFVYVISHPNFEGEYKVGIAKDWKSRLNSYQTSDPERQYKMEFKIETPWFRETEKFIHDLFPNKHEWVQGDLDEIIEAIQSHKSIPAKIRESLNL